MSPATRLSPVAHNSGPGIVIAPGMDPCAASYESIASNSTKSRLVDRGLDDSRLIVDLRNVIGVDKIELSFPVRWFESDRAAWTGSGRIASVGRLGLSATLWSNAGAPIVVTLDYVARTGQYWAGLSFNPSRIVDPNGWRAVPVREIWGATGEVLGIVGEFVASAVAPDEMRLKRLDLCRDFEFVADVGLYLCRLADLPRRNAKEMRLHRSPTTGQPETLTIRNKTGGGASLYDKHAESGAAPPGTLRFEVQARSWAETYGDMKYFGDITPDRCSELIADRWAWAKLGTEFLDCDTLAARLRDHGMGPRERWLLLGHLTDRAAGGSDEPSRATRAKWNKILAAVGSTLDVGVSLPGDGTCRRLDLNSGRAIVTRGRTYDEVAATRRRLDLEFGGEVIGS